MLMHQRYFPLYDAAMVKLTNQASSSSPTATRPTQDTIVDGNERVVAAHASTTRSSSTTRT